MTPVQPSLSAFTDELIKLSAAQTPEGEGKSWAERHGNAALAGKVVAANMVFRHGAKLAPVRWVGKEIAGVGMRAGMAGKPMINRPTREIAALFVDPQAVGGYEAAHALGKKLQGKDPATLKNVTDKASHIAGLLGMDKAKGLSEWAAKIPLESTGARGVVDRVLQPAIPHTETAMKHVKALAAAARKLVRR